MVDAKRTPTKDSAQGPVLLCIETSTRRGSIALRAADGTLHTTDLDEASSHGSDLLPAVDALMREAGGLGPGAIDWIAVGTGPGSYTGLRVGAATALGLARGADAELVGVPSLAAMGYGGLLPGERGAAVRNAFGGQVYVATYERSEDPTGPLLETHAPACCDPSAALDRMGGCPVWLIDDKTLEVLGSPSADQHVLRASSARAVDVLALASPAIAGHLVPGVRLGTEGIKPLYLRPFEAKNRRR